MSNQRIRLAKYLNKRQLYHATFSEIRHDNNNQPQVLLINIYPIYKNGHKIPLRSKDNLVDNQGHQIAATHVWTELTDSFLKVPYELLYGDQITFSAVVSTYNIVRDDIIIKRKQLWQNGLADKEKVYQDYRKQIDSLYKESTFVKNQAFENYKNHLLTFPEMKLAQTKADIQFKQERNKLYRSCQRKMDRRIRKAQMAISKLQMIDYTLTDIKDINIIQLNKQFKHIKRFKYETNRLQDINYTKFLAAHSILARQNNLVEWQKERSKI